MQYFSKYNLLNCNTVTVNCNIFYKIFFNTVTSGCQKFSTETSAVTIATSADSRITNVSKVLRSQFTCLAHE